jgi:hypothetical protein
MAQTQYHSLDDVLFAMDTNKAMYWRISSLEGGAGNGYALYTNTREHSKDNPTTLDAATHLLKSCFGRLIPGVYLIEISANNTMANGRFKFKVATENYAGVAVGHPAQPNDMFGGGGSMQMQMFMMMMNMMQQHQQAQLEAMNNRFELDKQIIGLNHRIKTKEEQPKGDPLWDSVVKGFVGTMFAGQQYQNAQEAQGQAANAGIHGTEASAEDQKLINALDTFFNKIGKETTSDKLWKLSQMDTEQLEQLLNFIK